ncbi:MAG: primosomal protein N' [Pseudomonadota bacterium]|nr:primosomal protein N' [Pseudomonadota bacterium]
MILQVALDTPLRRVFDYALPACAADDLPTPGVRVVVPFGRRRLIGVVVGLATGSSVPASKLRGALETLDRQPIFDPVTFELLQWAAKYYHHPLGEVIAAALPQALRDGQPAVISRVSWSLTPAGRREHDLPSTRRAPRQRALLAWLAEHEGAASAAISAGFSGAQLKALVRNGWAVGSSRPPPATSLEVRTGGIQPTEQQRTAIDAISSTFGRYVAHLLHGVTGSGKTEVYLQVIAGAIASGAQALVLVPEIALTPQLVDRFRARFSDGVVLVHSGLSNLERRDAWRAAHGGLARVIIGTRSAVFTSMPRLAMIIVDEEHDASYKQHEGFRYSARDLAVRRAQRARIPIVLGSATPSLETLENVVQGRYSKWMLPNRPGSVAAPRMTLVDLRRHAAEQGLSQPAMQAMRTHLAGGGQVIVFLNRRGYAPCLFCNACGWVAPCTHCDARMTLHRRAGQLRCHHCGACSKVPSACAECAQPLHAIGQGTERVEETLARLYPDAPLARLDRDTATARGAMTAVLDRVRRGEARILVGTQMLTKGHDFPEVSLVVVLDADQGLFASDFRATERLAQMITQVAGRAGRAARPGEVLIQTAFPEHPLLLRLISEGYDGFAAAALEERRAAAWPPFSRLAMYRAEARDSAALHGYLRAAADQGQRLARRSITVLGPASALLARRADHFRAHLLIESATRSALQGFLDVWLPLVDTLPAPPGLRASIDVDPLEVD